MKIYLLLGFLGAAAIVSLPLLSQAQEFRQALPPGSDLGGTEPLVPRELFHSEEKGGSQSYLVQMGNMAFSSPYILGVRAQQAGLSCSSCHVSGANNPALFIPGLSGKRGTFDTSSSLFNPKADNHVFDPVTIPSLRGVRFLAPYTHEGKFASLREFTENAIVNEFGGREAPPMILDAILAYMQDIDFLPNANLGPGNRLIPTAGEKLRRGEMLFFRPFPKYRDMSCATCHIPSSGFIDHRQHDVGSGGFFKTKTLMNANSNTPYFHDGRFDTYQEVIDYFDEFYDLNYSAQDKSDLLEYLTAVGGGTDAHVPVSAAGEMAELSGFVSLLDQDVASQASSFGGLIIDTVTHELREMVERFPGKGSTLVQAGLEQRLQVRGRLKNMVLKLRSLDSAIGGKDWDRARLLLREYHRQEGEIEFYLRQASPFSFYQADNLRRYKSAKKN